MFIDLDDFKTVNDTLGHDVGDKLLQNISERLCQALRATDTISRAASLDVDGTVARMGGDEFTVVLPDLQDAMQAEIVAENILHALQKPVRLDGREITLTASVGISVYPEDGADAQELMRNADAAMYHSKEQGRNAFHFFTQSMNEKAQDRLELDGELRRAMERGEFEIFFQPLVALSDRRTVGAEALLRWKHGDKGYISPARFIPMAEETGLIRNIGAWCLKHACAFAVDWKGEGEPLPYVSVNVSTRQLQDGGFADIVAAALADTGLEASRLVLEITESSVLDESARIRDAIFRIRDTGVRFAIDDFGTGYSSLSYLKSFPFEILKIDQAFIANIASNPDDMNLAWAIYSMAKSLKLKVVAEGVENEEQLGFLKDMEDVICQGWYFSRPAPNEEFIRLIDRNWELPD